MSDFGEECPNEETIRRNLKIMATFLSVFVRESSHHSHQTFLLALIDDLRLIFIMLYSLLAFSYLKMDMVFLRAQQE